MFDVPIKTNSMTTGRPAFISSAIAWSKRPSIPFQHISRRPRARYPVRSCSDITRHEVEKIAKLAQLRLSDDELRKIVPKIQKVIAFFDTINDVDVADVEPMTSAQKLQNVMREDVPHRFSNVDDLMGEAPSTEKDYIRVPKLSSNVSD